jgi:hypothetical protein
MPQERLRAALDELAAKGMALYDPEAQLVLILKWFAYNPIENENQAKGLNKQLAELPGNRLFGRFVECVRKYCAEYAETVLSGLPEPPEEDPETLREGFGKDSERVSEGFRNGSERVSEGFGKGLETVLKPGTGTGTGTGDVTGIGDINNTPCGDEKNEPLVSEQPLVDELQSEKESSWEEKILPDASQYERAVLHELKQVPGWPSDYAKDLAFIRTLAVDYPQVDLLEQAKRWRTYKLDKPLKPKSNPRLQFRNWCEIAARRAKERAVNGNGAARAGPVLSGRRVPRAFASLIEWAAEEGTAP